MRVFLIVSAWVLGVAGVLALAGFILWSKYGHEYVNAFEVATEEGVALGRAQDDAACYDGALTRLQRCDGIRCMIEAKVFAGSCFRSTQVRTALCDEVPRISNLLDYLAWVGETCEAVAPDNDGCEKVLEEVAKHCSQSD